MENSEWNWMLDDKGKPSDGLERAANEITWSAFGETVAQVNCGLCCGGLYSCPKKAGSSNDVIVNPINPISINEYFEELDNSVKSITFTL